MYYDILLTFGPWEANTHGFPLKVPASYRSSVKEESWLSECLLVSGLHLG